MKKIYHAFLIVFLAIPFYSYASPAKQIIIQFSQELSSQDEVIFRKQLIDLVAEKHQTLKQGNRWLLSISPNTSDKKFNDIIEKLKTIEGVDFVEEDRMMKPLSKPLIKPTSSIKQTFDAALAPPIIPTQ